MLVSLGNGTVPFVSSPAPQPGTGVQPVRNEPVTPTTAQKAPAHNPVTATSRLATETLLAAQGLLAAPNAQETTPTAQSTEKEETDIPETVAEEKSKEDGEASTTPEENKDINGLTPAEQQLVTELKQRDAEVKRHEQAHAAVGGQYAGAPTYEYQTGPDGRQYAIGGEVQINSAPLNDPEATIAKLQIVRRAALAPAQPSPQDQRVAAEANQGIAQAKAEIRAEEQAEIRETRREKEEEHAEESRNDSGRTAGPAETGQDNPRRSSQFGETGISSQQASDAFSQTAGLTNFPTVREIEARDISRAAAAAQSPGS